MFGMLNMIGTYESRKVDRYDDDAIGLMVSTAAITDSDKPYETAICHPKYNDGEHVIVELYDTKEEAQAGHNNWVAIMTAEKLPESLKDVSTAEVALLLDSMGDKSWRDCQS